MKNLQLYTQLTTARKQLERRGGQGWKEKNVGFNGISILLLSDPYDQRKLQLKEVYFYPKIKKIETYILHTDFF